MVATQPQLISRLTTTLAERLFVMQRQLVNSQLHDPVAKMIDMLALQVEKAKITIDNKTQFQTDLTIDDIDLYEANEAFAAQSVAVGKDLGFDLSKLNVNGGAIALGHPVGASGCRILVTLLHEMVKRDAKRGLATLCIGGGMGCATIVERD